MSKALIIYHKIGSVVLEENIFKISSIYFSNFVIISLGKRCGPSIWENLNSFHPRMLFAKFGWNWPSGSGEIFFLIWSLYFYYFEIISPWKNESSRCEQHEFPTPKGCFNYAKFVWNRLFWRRTFLKFLSLYFIIYLPLGKRHGSSFDQTCIQITQRCFVKFYHVVLKKKILKFHQ